MSLDPRDLGFQQGDPGAQLLHGKRRQILPAERRQRIVRAPWWKIIRIHAASVDRTVPQVNKPPR